MNIGINIGIIIFRGIQCQQNLQVVIKTFRLSIV